MLTSDLNVIYWGYISRRYYNTATRIKIFHAIMASVTVASWGFWEEIDLVWKTLSGIAAVLAIIFPY